MDPLARRRLGFLHVPKSGGSSLNESLYAAFGLEPTFVTEVMPRQAAVPPRNPERAVVRGSITYTLARNMPFLSGHASFSDLRSLGRDFIFTVLRDPRKRVVSLFTYNQRRADDRRAVRAHPALARHAGKGFRQFVEELPPHQTMAWLLLSDLPGYAQPGVSGGGDQATSELDDLILRGLQRLDVVYACSNQEVLDDLHARGVAPASREVRRNVSEGRFCFGDVGSRSDFLELIERACWLDRLVYQAASRIFPATVHVPEASDDSFLAELESRFGLVFA